MLLSISRLHSHLFRIQAKVAAAISKGSRPTLCVDNNNKNNKKLGCSARQRLLVLRLTGWTASGGGSMFTDPRLALKTIHHVQVRVRVRA